MTKQSLNNNSQNSYSIGVVTYVNRYHTYFKPNILNLIKYFPDKQIVCIINGHPNKLKHLAYLKEATQWLSSLNIQYVTFDDHQSLARCWNWILLMSSAQNNLFLNDDVLVKQDFRHDFENHLQKNHDFFAINNSFSHFLLSKNVVKKVGWFDERFLGIGQEDGDYLIRMAEQKVNLISLSCRDIINYVAPGDDPSFQKVSANIGKYSSVNREFMEKKWFFNHLNNSDCDYKINFIWNNEPYKALLKDGMNTPTFYDYSLLDSNYSFAPKTKGLRNKLSDFRKALNRFSRKFKI